MDETIIEQSISDYKLQLAQIESLLCSCDEESKEELIHLKQDVMDLIRVTEESLLSLKKSRLLQQLADNKNPTSTDATAQTEDSLLTDEREDDREKNKNDFLGTKCRVRHTFDWGATEYHNAMVLSSEEMDDGQSKVKVLFMNPTHVSMVPCSYFLDGKCRFTEESCRFSHGYLVDISDVEEYMEPDFSLLFEGGKCLAKYEDNIWYKATIRTILDDERIEVHYDTYNTDAVLDIHLVLPIETRREESSSSSESELDDECSRDVHEDKFVAQLSRKPLSKNGPLGEWEMHTRGIGSKLMAKMGYVFGKGLGREGEGRVEPIEITILPAGKSLDMVAELREKGRLHKPLRKKKEKSISKLGETSADGRGGSGGLQSENFDVFSFINQKLINTDASKNDVDFHSQRVRHNIEDSYQHLKKIRMRKKKGQSGHSKQDNGPNWNIQLFKNNEKASALKKRLSKQKESLKRNLGRDEEMVARLRSSISTIEQELKDLEQSGKIIENKLNSKAQHKKLTVF